jgi:hypothetical protein
VIRRNVPLARALGPPSTWRKIAIGTWQGPGDPTAYCRLEVDATALLGALEKLKAERHRASVLTLVVRAVAVAMRRVPEVNVMLQLGRVRRREHVHVMVPALVGLSGEELTGVLLRDCDLRGVRDLSRELSVRARALRSGRDPEFHQTKKQLGWIPGVFMYPLFRLLSFILYELNVWFPGLGVGQDAMGSVQVTSVGELGIDEAYGPLDGYARLPFTVVAGAIRETPVVREGRVEVRPMLPIGFSADHRVGDAFVFGRFLRELRALLTSEAFLLEEPDAPARPSR